MWLNNCLHTCVKKGHRDVELLLNRRPLRQISFVFLRRKPGRIEMARVWFRFSSRSNNDCSFISASTTALVTVFMPLGCKVLVALSSSSTESQLYNCEKESHCSRPVSNWGPFACEANVITTTLRKPACWKQSETFKCRLGEKRTKVTLSKAHCSLKGVHTFLQKGSAVSARFRTEDLSRVRRTWWPLHYRNSSIPL